MQFFFFFVCFCFFLYGNIYTPASDEVCGDMSNEPQTKTEPHYHYGKSKFLTVSHLPIDLDHISPLQFKLVWLLGMVVVYRLHLRTVWGGGKKGEKGEVKREMAHLEGKTASTLLTNSWVNVEHCGVSVSEVANAQAVQLLCPEFQWPSFSLPLLVSLKLDLTVGHSCSMKETHCGS